MCILAGVLYHKTIYVSKWSLTLPLLLIFVLQEQIKDIIIIFYYNVTPVKVLARRF
jgi:hypothetical protein